MTRYRFTGRHVHPFYGYLFNERLGGYVRGALLYEPARNGADYRVYRLTDRASPSPSVRADSFIGVVQGPLGSAPVLALAGRLAG